MLSFTGALRAVENLLQHDADGAALGLHTPVRFDATLVRSLLLRHDALNARFSEVVGRFGQDAEQTCAQIRDCATLLHQLRSSETIWLYPVIAAGIDNDAAARRQLMQLRVTLLAQVRGILRCFDALSRGVRDGSASRADAEVCATTLAAFLRRCAKDIYPLYALIGKMQPSRAA